MKRTPMNRATPGALAWQRKKRSVLAQKSKHIKARDASRKGPHADQLREYPYCEAKKAGMPHKCFGPLTVHEPWTKARGGPQDDRRNMVTIDAEGNRLISQDAEAMAWAYRMGFLVHAWDGPAWLAAGGVRRPHDREAA